MKPCLGMSLSSLVKIECSNWQWTWFLYSKRRLLPQHMEIFASVTRPFSHIWEGPGHVSVSVAPVIVAFAWYVGGVTIGAGRYCMGRAPNSNVLYMIVHGWGTLMQVSGGIARLVQNSSIVKSEPKLPRLWRISNMCFLILKIFLLFCCSLGFYVGLTYCFSQSRQLDCVQHLFMHFAPQYIRCKGPLRCPPHPLSPRNVLYGSTSSCMQVSDILPVSSSTNWHS